MKLRIVLIVFQFPSNGKAYLNSSMGRQREKMRAVSIPFKRESVSEPEKHIHPYVLDTDSFNSLQTGKRI